MTRWGLTLLEVLWALVLGLVVAGLTLRLLVATSRHLRDERAAAELQATVRGAIDYLTSELINVGWGTGRSDILDVLPGRVRFRARRGIGVACSTDPSGSVTLRRAAGYGRPPVAGRDSMAVLLEWDTTTTIDDAWLRLPVLGNAGSASCPDGDSALSVITLADPRLAGGVAVRLDAPVVSWEIIEVRSYMSGGDTWLGEQSLTGGGVVEPAFGPLDPSGFEIQVSGVGGFPVSGLTDAGTVAMTVRAITRSHGGRRVPIGTALVDSLAAMITLRNAGPGWGGP